MQVIKILGLLLLAGVLMVAALILLKVSPRIEPVGLQLVITNFEECAAAGNPVMESYPRQCRSVYGRIFVEDISNNQLGDNRTFNGCAVAGCSGQLCVSAEEAEGLITTCEYRAEYACYKEAYCGPQTDGACGWSETPGLQRCLANPPAVNVDMQVF